MIPHIFTQPPPIRDILVTESSETQDGTVMSCLPLMSGQQPGDGANRFGVPRLAREKHVRFLQVNLGRLPAPFIAADASRPWFFYWCLNAMCVLGEDVSAYREPLIGTARALQNETGGFGGGFGQMSHLATSYAIVLALAIVGGEECFEVVDRKAMWRWLCSLKEPEGGFAMCQQGEVDIRCGVSSVWKIHSGIS
jgi:protein farnesyltransferase subunit beta